MQGKLLLAQMTEKLGKELGVTALTAPAVVVVDTLCEPIH